MTRKKTPATKPAATIGETLKRVIKIGDPKCQFLFQCATGAREVKQRGPEPEVQRTAVTFTTQFYKPKDLVFPSQADYIGVVVWIPMETYKKVTGG